MIKKSSLKKIAVITGSQGQDGTLLYQFLKNKNYDVIRLDKKNSFLNDIEIDYCDILDSNDIKLLFKNYNIKEVYHLAAKVLSTENRNIDEKNHESFIQNFNINVKSFHNILINISNKTKVFYPTSSYIFQPSVSKLDENTKISPSNLYSINKATSFWLAKNFRKKFNLFVSTGIMFNHESSYRSDGYVTKKIVMQAKEILDSKRKYFEVYNLNQKVDWGHAIDYVEAMYEILQLSKPDDFIISSGSLYTIKEFIECVCEKLKIKLTDNMIKVKNDENLPYYYGDNSKIIEATNWKPKKSLEDIVEDMI